MVAIASPAGGELPVARYLAGRLGALVPELGLECDEFAPGRANLCWGGPGTDGALADRRHGLLLYGHLDTSLSGDPLLDRPVTARQRLTRLERRDGLVVGPGVAVAKAPAVAAAVGLLLAHRRDPALSAPARLLLAAGGTHRAAPAELPQPAGAPVHGAGDGVRRYLARRRPAAAVVAKCGPQTVLHEEPGSAYIQIEVAGSPGIVMARTEAQRDGGLPACAGAAVRGVEECRRRWLGRPLPAGTRVGRELGVGALSAGIPYKADLFAGLLTLEAYAVLAPGDEALELAAELAAGVRAALAVEGAIDLEVTARVLQATPAARTDPRSLVARVARRVWLEQTGAVAPPIGRWTGSTDGVLLRAAGVDTVRLGPSPVSTLDGEEGVELDGLVAAARRYAAIVLAFGAETAGGATAVGAAGPADNRLALRDTIPPTGATVGAPVVRGGSDER